MCRPDLTVRAGEALYSGTPLGQKVPFVPGYSAVGVADAVGDKVSRVKVGDRVAALTVVASYKEYLYWRSDRLIPVPEASDAAAADELLESGQVIGNVVLVAPDLV